VPWGIGRPGLGRSLDHALQGVSQSPEKSVSDNEIRIKGLGINMEAPSELKSRLESLLRTQQLGVLSTQYKGQPYASLVAFAATEDSKYLLFATTRSTRKYANIASDSRVAMLMDNRSNRAGDFHRAMAVTATGNAEEVGPNDKVNYLQIFLEKHPHLKDFVNAPSCALLRIKIETYYLVNRFQKVFELHIENGPDHSNH
jgi:nitroimidazol reductase NimA-like FMN-containing flavoprotein (pyridoxamine 5'-phosphate oxidase superfamily)